MKTEQINNFINQPVCIGAGLVALDVVISSDSNVPAQFLAGGSCGNVITILSYLGWSTYPVARLSNNVATDLLLQDLKRWNVNENLLTFTEDGSTPIIIHRILKDKNGHPKHKFEFRNPEDGTYLPAYKPCLAKAVKDIVTNSIIPQVFYFDRINRASIEMAKAYKEVGAFIFFEPSSIKDENGFKECLELADIIKFSDDRIPDFDRIYPLGQVHLEIQTLGERGLKFRKKGEHLWSQLQGYSIDNVVDSAGAGDWCSAGIIMNLCKYSNSLTNIDSLDLIFALQFGQVLSALNCTFEGARGLMYNIRTKELLSTVHQIISSELKKIPQRSKPEHTYQNINYSRPVRISSLFA